MAVSRLGMLLPYRETQLFLAGFLTSCAPGLEQTGLTGSEIPCWDTLSPEQSERPVLSVCWGLAQRNLLHRALTWLCLQLEEITAICAPPTKSKWESSRNRAVKSQKFLMWIIANCYYISFLMEVLPCHLAQLVGGRGQGSISVEFLTCRRPKM